MFLAMKNFLSETTCHTTVPIISTIWTVMHMAKLDWNLSCSRWCCDCF